MKVEPGTALPWRYSAGDLQAYTDGKPGLVVRRRIATLSIAYMGSDERDANARYIVTAANAYPVLIEALQEARSIVDAVRTFIASEYRDARCEPEGEWLAQEARKPHNDLCELQAQIDATLTLALGEQS